MSDDNSGLGRSLSSRGPLLLGVIVLVILVGGFGGWAVFTQIAGAVVASGRVEVEQNRQVVQHLDGGIVDTIAVTEGDTVDAGEILIRLDGTELRSELAIVEGQLNEIMARRGRLEAERDGSDAITFDPRLMEAAVTAPDAENILDGQKRLFEARRDTLTQEVDQLNERRNQIRSKIDGVTSQQEGLRRQLELIREELADQQQLLDSGLAQKSRLLSLQREEANLTGRLGELEASRAESEGQITEIASQILGRRTTRREEAIAELREITSQQYELLERRRALSNRLSRLDIRAPVGGVVYDLQVHAQQSVIRAAEPLLYVVPQDRPLIISARVEPIHVDQVFPGQRVNLRFSALSSRTTPELFGTVTQVSADAFTEESTGQSYYTARMRLNEQEAAKLPDDVELLPGMPVDAFLRTDDRTPLAYLIRPLSDYFAKAFRES